LWVITRIEWVEAISSQTDAGHSPGNGTTLGELGWRKEPRGFQVEHDLGVNDFRLDLIEE